MKIIIAALAFLLVSCASHKKAAINLTEEGLHEAALEQWVLAYQNDPKDLEVQVGLRISQEKVSNERLVRIRDLRQAKDDEQALDELQSLMELQSKHGIQLDFNSSTFQGRETAILWKHQKSQVLNLISQMKPLAAELRYRKYTNVFQSIPDYPTLRSTIDKTGINQCKTLRKGLTGKPFYRSFVTQYCKFFDPSNELKTKTATISSVLFAHPVIQLKIDGADDEMTTKMLKATAEGFEASAWYHPESKNKIQMEMTGRYKWEKSSVNIPQSHNYTVSIPYTAYESVRRTRTVPYSDQEYRCENGNCNNVTVTKYKSEDYYESEAVTRYRDETRVHKYAAKKNKIDFELVLKGTVRIQQLNHPFTFVKKETEHKILHDENLPKIGLFPMTQDVTKPMAKLEYYSILAGGDLRLELDALWIKQFCSSPSVENVIRCRRAPSYPETFVDTWFLNNHGVSAKDAEALVGRF